MSGAGAPRPSREVELIRSLMEQWGPLAKGIGDDAAVLDLPRGDSLVASVDTALEDHHFRRDWLSAREIGYRAVAAALSDLAAMAARPLGVLVSIALPPSWRLELPALANGIGEAVMTQRTYVLGGNLAEAEKLSITTTVLGANFSVLRRDAVLPGHVLYVTGVLGGPGAALRALVAGSEPRAEWMARFRHPVPRIPEALWLGGAGAVAAIDVSDGLAADLEQLANASGLRLEVDLDLVPRVSGVTQMDAAAGGEEYELILASPAELDTRQFRERFGIPLTRVGRAFAGSREVVLTTGGVRVANPPGHDHFSA